MILTGVYYDLKTFAIPAMKSSHKGAHEVIYATWAVIVDLFCLDISKTIMVLNARVVFVHIYETNKMKNDNFDNQITLFSEIQSFKYLQTAVCNCWRLKATGKFNLL